jgi:hypothetical protein
MARRSERSWDSLAYLAGVIRNEYNVGIYLYSGPADQIGLANLISAIGDNAQKLNCLLILSASGGSLDAAYWNTKLIH